MKTFTPKSGILGVSTCCVILLLSAVAFCFFGEFTSSTDEITGNDDQSIDAPAIAESFGDSVDRCGLRVEASTIDFGAVYEGTSSSHALRLTNTSNHSIEVVGASASCGCTSVETETPFTVPPGQERHLRVQMNTTRNIGELHKIVTIFVHEGSSRFKFPISVRALSMPLVELDRREIDVGMIPAGEIASAALTITLNHEQQRGPQPTESGVHVVASPSDVECTLLEVEPPEHTARRWKVIVSIDGRNVPDEGIDGDLIIRTPSTVESLVRIPVRARQHSFLSYEPSRVNFGLVGKQSEVTREIRFSCDGDHSFEILSVALTDGPTFLHAVLDADQQKADIVADLKTEGSGFFQANLLVRYQCDLRPQQSLIVPVSGYRLSNVR